MTPELVVAALLSVLDATEVDVAVSAIAEALSEVDQTALMDLIDAVEKAGLTATSDALLAQLT